MKFKRKIFVSNSSKGRKVGINFYIQGFARKYREEALERVANEEVESATQGVFAR